MSTKSFNENMESFRILIWNASNDPLIQPRLQIYTYTPETLDEGKALWEATDSISKNQSVEQNEKSEATRLLNETLSQSKKKLIRLKKICRLAFPDNDKVWNRLNLKTLDISRLEDWLDDAEKFHKNLQDHPDWIAILGNYAYPTETLNALMQEPAEIKKLQENQIRETGDAQQATTDKWEKYSQLKDWCNKLKGIARIEFENDPQLLEKLGIRVRS